MDMKNGGTGGAAKQNAKLYAALICVLICLSVIVGVTTALSKSSEQRALSEASKELGENDLLAVDKLDGAGQSERLDKNDKSTDKGTGIGKNGATESGGGIDSSLGDPGEVGNGGITGGASGDGKSDDEKNEALGPDNGSHDTASESGTSAHGGEESNGANGDSGGEKKSVNADGEIPVFTSPVKGAVIVSFSDTTPVFSVTMNDYRIHSGVDLAAEEGSAVLAAADGVIGAIWDDPMMGKCMSVVHSGGAVSVYKGLYETLPDGISEGTWVSAGQVVAAVGDSALQEVAEESHVHYELTIAGENVDPASHIDFSTVMKWED